MLNCLELNIYIKEKNILKLSLAIQNKLCKNLQIMCFLTEIIVKHKHQFQRGIPPKHKFSSACPLYCEVCWRGEPDP